MPYGIVVTRSEADIVRAIWGKDGVEMISTQNNIVWFNPKRGKTITSAIMEFDLGDTHDANVRRRLLERIATLCGKSLLEPDTDPIETAPVSVHIENEDADKEAEQTAPETLTEQAHPS